LASLEVAVDNGSLVCSLVLISLVNKVRRRKFYIKIVPQKSKFVAEKDLKKEVVKAIYLM